MAERLGINAFATTLTLSPHKVSRIIFEIGKQFPRFVPIDFKKQGGFLRSIQLSEEYDLYRQSYCGCEFSQRY
jgi:predicted adenine nucleotide alpha hydrolase (AANH) superfamily ATPase